ncbi:MAG TPA: hypothetical protein VF623_00665 [Segetibacter sp.]|jgi:hypothetical protein
MKTMVINMENEEQVNLIQSFLEKNNLKGKIFSNEDKEDYVLSRLMNETDYKEVIDTSEFIQMLRL